MELECEQKQQNHLVSYVAIHHLNFSELSLRNAYLFGIAFFKHLAFTGA